MKKPVIFSLIAIAFIVTFFPTFSWMVQRFLEDDSYYSHGFLIPFIAAWLIGRKRPELARLPAGSSVYGLCLLAAGLCLHLMGWTVFRIGFISGFAMLLSLFGLALYLFGPAVTRAVSFPLGFLVFMVPLPRILFISLTFKMKMLAAWIASNIVAGMHIAIERAGSMIYLPNGVLTVGNECSGINSLISLFMLSILFSYVAERTAGKRLLFVALSLPIALAANIARIVFLILAAYVYGVEAATKGFLHFGAGITLWAVALALSFALWRLLNWKTETSGATA